MIFSPLIRRALLLLILLSGPFAKATVPHKNQPAYFSNASQVSDKTIQ
jgi:hypothetical protein